MTPDQVSILNTIVFILDKIGVWPPLTLLTFVCIGPWVGLYFYTRSNDRAMSKIFGRQDKRFEEVVSMYDNNVELVKSYEGIAENLQDLVILTTQTMQKLVEKIDSNLYCPIIRKGTQQKEI